MSVRFVRKPLRYIILEHDFTPLEEHIRLFSSQDWTLFFRHTLHEENACTDWLAKYGANMEHAFHLWLQCPPTLPTTLLADAMRIVRSSLFAFFSAFSSFPFIKKKKLEHDSKCHRNKFRNQCR